MHGQLQFVHSLVLLTAVGILLGIAGSTTAVEVLFPDANLEAVVRNYLGIKAPISLADTDVERLRLFNASGENITKIQGLQYATNLEYIDLGGNKISDISPVAGLTNLPSLALDSNQISDISAVAGLANLKELFLGYNQISDISAVSSLTRLVSLSLKYNQISDISAVSGLTNLKWLGLANNQISDISAVTGLNNLVGLFLNSNHIIDIFPVAGLQNLEYLMLNDNQIESMDVRGMDLSSLGNFTISKNPLTKVFLADTTLTQKAFNAVMGDGSTYRDRIGIAELGGVKLLDMSRVDFSEITDLAQMRGMDDLEELLLAGASNLDGSQVVALTAELDSLNRLDVRGLWDSFDAETRISLREWDDAAGNTLIVPEPSAIISLFIFAALILALRMRR